ncbi:site-specific integrase [Serratia marcescens]|uniref:site-specific integrase n=1 Tax=Raoultella ornithinolytica TaxID=54291 RepID=UPI002A5986B4|nr:site-specific integrase [Raoultella ornithinolytica]WPO23939.1 site-specific integrase [Raoultella ornithinolytica]BEO06375.1 integrase [Serratia marcescens]
MNNSRFLEKHIPLEVKHTGYYFFMDDDKWILDRDSVINTNLVSSVLHPKLIEGYRKTLAFYACKYSPRYAINVNSAMSHFVRIMNPSYIDESTILNYKDTLSNVRVQYLVNLRSFLKKWYSLGYYGVNEKTITLLKAMILKVKESGYVVKQECPQRGPLTDDEHHAFNNALKIAYEVGNITLFDFSITMLVSFTGRRPLQITSLKFKDIIREETIYGEIGQFINFPRIKQGLGFRKSFRKLMVSEYVFNLIKKQAFSSVKIFEGKIGRTLTQEEISEVPVFLSKIDYGYLKNDRNIIEKLSSDIFHASKNIVDYILNKIVKDESVISIRTGEVMKINARRLRYTLGTRLARDGESIDIIAELLDHSSIASAGIYVENLPDNINRINKAVSTRLNFFANAFLGKLNDGVVDELKGLLVEKSCSSCINNLKIPCRSCVYFRNYNRVLETKG